MKNYIVYIHYGINEEILYVGQTSNMKSRFSSHINYSAWIKDVATIKLLHCKDENECTSTERELIRNHKPIYNISLKKLASDDFLEKVHFVFTKHIFYDRVKILLSLESDERLANFLGISINHIKMARLGMTAPSSMEKRKVAKILGCADWEISRTKVGRFAKLEF